ncbi:MAG: biotin--[acetyl-CoA-carboxylase] ligase [Clostridia bacterium]|nr:biotin--[acetyl-CoA-carboxylase] ligase [Clostridia bacterium]
MLTKARIEAELNKIGVKPPKIVFYESTDSTNTRAKEYAKNNPENREKVIFIANRQTAGRGRLGRSFVSEAGAGIYMSILSYPNECGYDATEITSEAAVALSRAIESLCDCCVVIKWVNDIYLGGKKLCGILTEAEMTVDGKIAYQVVGMGINVYKNAISYEISDIATSIEHQLGNAPDRSQLVARIISECLSPVHNTYKEYRARSFIIGKNVQVIKSTESYSATVLDINEDFSLSVDRNGNIERLFTGEISIKI